MEVVRYTDGSTYAKSYQQLLSSIYHDHPRYVAVRMASFLHNSAPVNPFLKFGQWVGVLIFDHDIPIAHACIVHDSRLPDMVSVGYVDIYLSTAITPLYEAIKLVAHDMGVSTVRGPVNFSTWQDFRFITSNSDTPPFFLEPYANSVTNKFWETYCIHSLVLYHSLVQDVVHSGFARFGARYDDLVCKGFSFKKIIHEEARNAATSLHTVALNSFAKTDAFTQISFEEFSYLYEVAFAQPNLYSIFVAVDSFGTIIGFLVCVLDIYSDTEKRLVFKSIAVHSDYRKIGIASGLFFAAEKYAHEQGCTKYVYATMQIGNQEIHTLLSGTEVRTYAAGEFQV